MSSKYLYAARLYFLLSNHVLGEKKHYKSCCFSTSMLRNP